MWEEKPYHKEIHMKKTLLTALLGAFATTATFANEPAQQDVTQSMGYVSIGVGPLPIPLPVFAGGYRFQDNHWGADFPLQVISVGSYATHVQASAIAHYYPKPNAASQMYVGAGIAPGVAFSTDGGSIARHSNIAGTIAPQLVLGHQYQTDGGQKRFLEAKINVPTVSITDTKHTEVLGAPLMTVNYGFGF